MLFCSTMTSLDERWKHRLVLSNGDFPGVFEPDLERLQQRVQQLESEGGYALQVTDQAVLIVGKSEQGVWNGVMTLVQLSRHQVSVGGIDYDQVEI